MKTLPWTHRLGLALLGASLMSACTVLPSSQLNPGRTSNRTQPGLAAGAKLGNLVGSASGASLNQGSGLAGAGAGIVASGGGNAIAGAGIVASGGGNAVTGAGIVASGGGNAVGSPPNLPLSGLLANDGVGLLANDGGGLIPAPAGLVANASGNGLIANDGGSYLGGRALALNAQAMAYRLQDSDPSKGSFKEPIASATVQVYLQDGSAWGKAVAANADGYFAFPEQPPEGALAVATGQHRGRSITVRGPITRGTGLWVICPGSSVALAILKAEGQKADQSLDATRFRAWADAICEAARSAPVDDLLENAQGMKAWYEERLAAADSSLGKLAEVALSSRESLTVSVGGGSSLGAETLGATTGGTSATTTGGTSATTTGGTGGAAGGGSASESTDAGSATIKPGVQSGGRADVLLN